MSLNPVQAMEEQVRKHLKHDVRGEQLGLCVMVGPMPKKER